MDLIEALVLKMEKGQHKNNIARQKGFFFYIYQLSDLKSASLPK